MKQQYSYAKRLFTLLFFLTFTIAVNGQSGERNYTLMLNSGAFTPASNVQNLTEMESQRASQVFDGYNYFIIQFNEIPGLAQKSLMKAAGITLLNYLPYYAFYAAVPAGKSLNELQQYNVRSLMAVHPEMKMESGLATGTVPVWAQRGGSAAALVVKTYSGVNAAAARTALLAQGVKITAELAQFNQFTIECELAKTQDVAALPFIYFIETISAEPTPDDTRGRSLHRSNAINTDYAMGRHYDGTGVNVALADDGIIGPHIDYTGRLTQYITSNGGNHGDMTSGILMGGGNLDPTIKGMATGAYLHLYGIGGYGHINDAVANFNTLSTVITSTSYSQTPNGGTYSTDAMNVDEQVYNNPQLQHVFSAGNAGTADQGYGAGAGWGNITGGFKAAKSTIACGNLNSTDALENSSSRGPAKDGRIKPDICANGINQMSTDGNNTYQVGGGTSAAAPGIAGITAQLYHAYRTLNSGIDPDAALIKACLLNSAEDLGNPGPDFKHGWGRVNALRAVTTLEDNRYLDSTVAQGATNTHTITVPAGVTQLKVMTYWNDVEGSTTASLAIVNDINTSLADPAAASFNPWKLDHSPNATALNTNAVRGIDARNNMEQVTIDNPAAGTYTLSVEGFMIPQGPQKYFVVYEFRTNDITVTYPMGGEGFVPGEAEFIRWDAEGTTAPFTIEYSTDDGTNWNVLTTNQSGTLRYYNWSVPNTITGQAKVRVSRGAASGVNTENFAIIGLTNGIAVHWACPDSVLLKWNPVTGATGYEVSMLGAMYMDSVGTTTDTSFVISGTNPVDTHWFSVRALTANNGAGRRANAISKNPGTFGCPIPFDVALTVLSPGGGNLFNCLDLDSMQIVVQIDNFGINSVSNIPVHYILNGGTQVDDTLMTTINSGASATFAFPGFVDLSATGSYTLDAWATFTNDGNAYNDSSFTVTNVGPGILATLPYSDNFESFGACPTTTDCEVTNCSLANGWFNAPNGTSDDIDWRTDAGGTPSANTGPSIDHNPGTAAGKYLYLESSGPCPGKTATLISPCIDLTNAALPELSFWYHMYGVAMGSLHIDIMSNGAWATDVITPISGNQGNIWKQGFVNLAPYVGQIITVRFRGITGNDFTSDLALDDIGISENTVPPATAFIANKTDICAGEIVTFSDQSQNSPTGWAWTITPAATFVNSTTAVSQNPEVQFTNSGTYDVQLIATNQFGSDTLSKQAYILVDQAAAAPVFEDFQGAVFPPAQWNVASAGNTYTWQSNQATGSNGQPTLAAFVNNFAYNSPGAEDGLVVKAMDFTNIPLPMVTFNVAYARYSATFSDGMRIDVSTDCGVTYVATSYLKLGVDLATVPDQTTSFVPGAAADWRNDTLDLTAYAGNKVLVKFVNINGYGNGLFVDNVNLFDATTIGVNELDAEGAVVVYPNPSQGLFNIELNGLTSKQATARVYDMRGRQVFMQQFNLSGQQFTGQVNMNGLAAGIYHLRVESGSSQRQVKLVVY